ncbi:MAG: tryptophan--tRNA ligase [Nitrospinae bacterium]|nr:tryptophan--tRNA ligase [Nitrospinota bacterium]
MTKKRVLSGMQSSGKLHLGNYLGALENWVTMQEAYDCYYFVADWHALSSNYEETDGLKDNIVDLGVNWLSAGIDPEKSVMFIQSLVPQHAVLFLLLGMITPIPWLERVPSYKEKLENVTDRDMHTHGFLGYPVLQAADIVLYKADVVPVGIDQLPHLELTREIVRHFHNIYKTKVFVEPDAKMAEVKKLPGLDGRKMSKSYGNAIFLSDTPDERDKKTSLIVTDPARVRKTDKGDPEKCVAYAFHKVFNNAGRNAEIANDCRNANIGCVACKKELAKNIAEYMAPFDERRAKWAGRKNEVMDILRAGSDKARVVAAQTLAEAEAAMKIDLQKI